MRLRFSQACVFVKPSEQVQVCFLATDSVGIADCFAVFPVVDREIPTEKYGIYFLEILIKALFLHQK